MKENENNAKFEKNIILYGPPGTGKTYNTVRYAVAIIENRSISEVAEENYEDTLNRYKAYKNQGWIEFITFHQSYSYEEFIEGIKPEVNNDEKNIKYIIKPGIFKEFCDSINLNLNDNPSIWKVSLEGTGDNNTRKECMENGHIRIGYDETDDTNLANDKIYGKRELNAFINKMQIGDIVLSCYSETTIDAIGVITGDYEVSNKYKTYKRLRKVNWVVKNIKEDITKINHDAKLTLPTVYELNIDINDILKIIKKYRNNNYVFIIDEINRGNISKIFGELITLIEDKKRIGSPECIKTKLPYSKELFGVPDNLYILGTMNTADRSITTMDTALRRRFSFVEMMPNPEELKGVYVQGMSIQKMLTNLNNKIEVLFDREHTIGHAYFMPLVKEENPSINTLANIFLKDIIPLLQEYFYDDYGKICLVLGDNKKDNNKEIEFINEVKNNPNEIFGDTNEDMEETQTYRINKEAFYNIESYSFI